MALFVTPLAAAAVLLYVAWHLYLVHRRLTIIEEVLAAEQKAKKEESLFVGMSDFRGV